MHDAIRLPVPPFPHYLESGLTRYGAGDRHPNRTGLGMFDLLFVTEGTLYIGEEDRLWALGAGDMLLLLPDRAHYAWRDCGERTVFYWLHFQAEGGWREETDEKPAAGGIRLPKHGAVPDRARMAALFGGLLRLARESREAALWEEQRLFLSLLEELARDGGTAGKPATLRIAEQAERYLKTHYRAEVTNASLAAALNYHPNYIARAMKRHFGCTPLSFLHDYRLEQAKLLLIKTDWPVARIAEHVGFRLAPYFTRCFKQKTGLAPAAYRKQFMAGTRG